MATIYDNIPAFPKGTGFSSAKGSPICAFPQNQYLHGSTAQARIADLTPNTLLPGTAIEIKNDTTPTTGKDSMKAGNPMSFTVSAVVSSNANTLSGFVLESPITLVDDAGNGGLPIAGGTVDVALIGSRTELFLPVHTDMVNIELNKTFYWDPTNKYLTTTSGSNIEMKGCEILSSVVKGNRRKLNVSTVEWEEVDCILVRL